jgi:beta-glucosidase
VFPPDFRFGVATSAHQVEGGNDRSDWWAFEQAPGAIADGTRSGSACEHFSRFRDDLDLVKALSLDTYRFSVEWARIEPEPGRFDPAAREHYREVVAGCRERGLEPFVTLYHFTLPAWLAENGGWLAPDSPERFARYVRFVCEGLSGQVTYWVTINEPVVYLYHAYLLGRWPPARRSFPQMIRAGRNLLRAHFAACRILREYPAAGGAAPQVGVAKHLRVFDPARDGNRLDAWAASGQEAWFNWAFLDGIERGRFPPPLGYGERVPGAVPAQDYVGVNYYTRDRVRFALSRPDALFGVQTTTPGAPLSDLKWEIYPEGLARLIRAVHRRYGKPIWVTENGVADAQDARRPAFLVQHLARVAAAVAEGIPVKGYLHWSLYDNFEWADGYAARFGLYALDRDCQARHLRPSGRLYAEIAAAHEIRPDLLDRHPLVP